MQYQVRVLICAIERLANAGYWATTTLIDLSSGTLWATKNVLYAAHSDQVPLRPIGTSEESFSKVSSVKFRISVINHLPVFIMCQFLVLICFLVRASSAGKWKLRSCRFDSCKVMSRSGNFYRVTLALLPAHTKSCLPTFNIPWNTAQALIVILRWCAVKKPFNQTNKHQDPWRPLPLISDCASHGLHDQTAQIRRPCTPWLYSIFYIYHVSVIQTKLL